MIQKRSTRKNVFRWSPVECHRGEGRRSKIDRLTARNAEGVVGGEFPDESAWDLSPSLGAGSVRTRPRIEARGVIGDPSLHPRVALYSQEHAGWAVDTRTRRRGAPQAVSRHRTSTSGHTQYPGSGAAGDRRRLSQAHGDVQIYTAPDLVV